MFRFRFRRWALRAGLTRRSNLPDLSRSDWAQVRVALHEGRQAYEDVMAEPPALELRPRDDRASRVDYSLMVQ